MRSRHGGTLQDRARARGWPGETRGRGKGGGRGGAGVKARKLGAG